MEKLKIAVLDTETASLSGAVYDVGVVITDKKGVITKRYNALVREVITDPALMMGAFYAKKIFSHYLPMIERREIAIKSWAEIANDLRNLLADVDVIAAYNLAFDKKVIRQTHSLLGDGQPLMRPTKQLDIWRFACMTLLSQKTFKDLARARGWTSKAGNIMSGAEVAYRFASGKWDFIEDHTALSDCEIETDILARCYAAKKAIPYNIVDSKYAKSPWRLIQN